LISYYEQLERGNSYSNRILLDGVEDSKDTQPITSDVIQGGIPTSGLKSIIEHAFGEASSGRVRITLFLPTTRMKKYLNLLEGIVKCSSEQELLEFFQVSEGPNAVTFNFFYAGRDNLSDCVKGDGFCSIRNAMILENGMVLFTDKR
jgi:hypothetical protein